MHCYRGALPGSRAELYNEICEVLLWRRHTAKGLSPTIRGDQQISDLLERLDRAHALGFGLSLPSWSRRFGGGVNSLVRSYLWWGVALSKAFDAAENAGSGRRKSRNPRVGFCRTFLEVVSGIQTKFVIRVEDLMDIASIAKDSLVSLGSGWASTVAGRLLDNARPFFLGEQPVSVEVESTIRLPALCLAVEAEQVHSAPELGNAVPRDRGRDYLA